MPFYEYQCERCGHHLEAMQKLSDSPLKKCPECGKPALQRLMSAPVFRLKGGGWYETDFKSDQDSKRNLADHPNEQAAKDDKPKEDKAAPAETAAKDAANDAAKPADKSASAPAATAKPAAAAEKPSAAPAKVSRRGAAPAASAHAGGKSARKPARKPTRKPAARR